MITLSFEDDYLTANGITAADVCEHLSINRGEEWLKQVMADMDSARVLDAGTRDMIATAINAAIAAKG